MSLIAAPHCDCADCRATHWQSDGDPTVFSAHEVADAFQAGQASGAAYTARSLIRALTEFLQTDPYEPVCDSKDT